ncbi:MAG TPA: SMI1/KNR4 family protein, partial [Propioniciclava sp.]|nr:SMI1/KNR4 family protein [Propioniciclava sp.]
MTARNTGHFDGVDLEGLWSDSEYSRTHYEGPAPDDATLALVEEALGYRLPDSFVELARVHNGGL